MTVRYGVGSNYCGPRTVEYQPDGCNECLSIKLGEVQLFEVDFGKEVKCNSRRVGCVWDYDEVVSVTAYNASPETTFGSGSIAVTLKDFEARTGVVRLLVDAKDSQLSADEKWKINVTVEFESGRCLKQCFLIFLIPCEDVCSVQLEVKPNCCGPILGVISNCNMGTLFVYDEVLQYPKTVCVLVSANCDALYTLDGIDPHDDNANPIPVASGTEIKLCNSSEIQGFRLANADGCGQICVSRTYRGS